LKYVCISFMLTFNAKGNNVVQWSIVVEYQTRNRDLVVGSIHTRSTASNLEQVANLLCAQANSASYPRRDGEMSSSYGYGVN